jgi:predicted PurR-regulated permease PerM
MKTISIDLRNIIFLLLMVVVILITATLFGRYISLLIVSLVIVQMFHPLYKFLLKRIKNSGISTLLSIIVVLLTVVIPITLLILLVVSEIQSITNSTEIFESLSDLDETVNNIISSINQFLTHHNLGTTINQVNLAEVVGQIDKIAVVRDQLLPFVGGIASLSGEILFTLFLMLLSLIYLFPEYEKLPAALAKISPLDNDIDKLLVKRFRDTIRGVVKGTFIVAVLQATAVIIPMIFLNIGAPVLLWVIMVILSIVPIGSGLVWGPVGLAIIIGGSTSGDAGMVLTGLGLIIYGAIIINVIDTTVRPRLMKDAVNLHPLVTIFSVLGGISMFGFLGILYGPLIVVIFLTVMEVYGSKYINKKNTDNG